MMCFSRPTSTIRVDGLIDGLILQILTMIERKSSARTKGAREGPHSGPISYNEVCTIGSQADVDDPRITNKQCFPFGIVGGLPKPIAPTAITRHRKWLAVT
jgi:hypothetical protein